MFKSLKTIDHEFGYVFWLVRRLMGANTCYKRFIYRPPHELWVFC